MLAASFAVNRERNLREGQKKKKNPTKKQNNKKTHLASKKMKL